MFNTGNGHHKIVQQGSRMIQPKRHSAQDDSAHIVKMHRCRVDVSAHCTANSGNLKKDDSVQLLVA